MRRADVHTAAFVGIALLTAIVVRFGGEPPVGFQLAVLAALVAVVGLPHGALDPLVARQAGLLSGRTGTLRYLAGYVVQGLLAAAAWLAAPFLVLPVFLVVSAAHFGGDWPRLQGPTRWLAGATVVSAPFVFHAGEVASLLEPLADEVVADRIAGAGRIVGPVVLFATAALLARGRRAGREAVEIATLILAAWAVPPLVYFVVYFCCLHSPRHIADVLARIEVSGATAARTAITFTVLALLGATAAVAIGSSATTSPDEETLRIVFIGLAALTVPHMVTLARAEPLGSGAPTRR